MLNYKKLADQFIIVFLYAIPLILLAGYDFSFVTYDSEPDYVSAAFHINKYGLPFSSHHPGTITQYLISLPLLVGNYFHFPFSVTVILMRLTELVVLAILIFSSINLMIFSKIKTKLFCYSLVWLLIFIYPSSSVLFRYISAEILLFGVSFLTCALWFKHLKDENNCMLIGFIIASGMNIKPTFIFLLIVLSSFHILSYAYYSKTYRGFRALIKIFTYGIVFFTIFSIPKIFQIMPIMLNMVNDWFRLINSIFSMLLFWQFLLLGAIISSTLYLFYWAKNKGVLSHNQSNYLNNSIKEGWVIAIPVALFVLYKLYYYFIHPEIDYLVGLGQWESLGIMRRNSIPLYAFLVFFILKEVIKKILKLGNFKPLLFSFLLIFTGTIASTVSASKPHLFQKSHVRLFDQSVIDLKKVIPEARIYVYHDNYFDSLIQFYMWTSIRYGNCNDDRLKETLTISYPDLNFDNFSYISATRGISRCDSNISNNDYVSLYNRWLNVTKDVVRSDLCSEFNSVSNNKVFLLDRRYVDVISLDEIIAKLNLAIETCGFKMNKNINYFVNSEILAYDIY